MNYEKYDLEKCKLHIIKTNKFKTIEICFYMYDEVTKQNVTMRNALIDMLSYATRNYPTKRELIIRCQELYSLIFNSSNVRFGNYLITKFSISLLNPKYTEEGMLEESLELLKEILFNPLITNDGFNEEYFQIVKNDLIAEAMTVKEQPRLYSNIRLLEQMGPDQAYAIHGYSDIEILKKMTGKTLYEYYQSFFKNASLDIVVVGEVDGHDLKDIISKVFPMPFNNKREKPIVIEHDLIRSESKKVIEHDHYKQSKLAIGCKFHDLTEFEFRYVANMYSVILGGVNGLLMKNVREKNSLAYYIASSLGKADNLIIIDSGINHKNFDKAMKIIIQTLSDVKEGKFDEEYLKKGQTDYISSLDGAMETSTGMMEILLGQILFNSESLETRKEKMLKVTKKDIMDFAKKVSIDTIYLLEGE